MTKILPKLSTFEQFIEWYSLNELQYELHKGLIVKMLLCHFEQFSDSEKAKD